MSFPKYPEYKDSGVDWLGQVPGHWDVQPFKHQVERNDGGVWGEDPDGIDDTIVLRSTEQTVDGHWKLDDPAPRKLSESEIRGSLLVENDLLLTKSSGSSLHIGKTTLVTAEVAAMRCCYSNFMQRIRMRPTFLPKLAWYVMNNDLARLQFDLLSNSSTGLANLNATMVGQIVVPVAPLPEQTQIAAFLDRETAKIDALVAEQRRLMALLKEKRQAVISHAVTRGLNPHAPLKPSGVEWLGDVPEHWAVAKTVRYFKVAMGQTILREDLVDDGAWPVFSATDGDHYFGRINEPQVRLAVGDIVIPARGNSIGAVKLVKEPATTTQTTIYCKNLSNGRLNPSFVFHFLKGCRENLFYFTQTAIPQITVEEVGSNPLLIPPLAEQTQIAAFLDRETSRIDTLTTEAQRAIDLLQERRTALISAAVTGQIDVRKIT